MAERDPAPGFFPKRDLLYAERPDPEALRRAAASALGAGLFEVALEFSGKAGDTAGAERVLEAARLAGDTFAVEAALRALGRSAPAETWVEVAETALAAGTLWFAYRAFEKADHQEGLERTRRAMAAAGIEPPASIG